MRKVALLLSLLACVFGQGYLQYPVPRGGASNESPCGNSTFRFSAPVISANFGKLLVKFTVGPNQPNDGACYLAFALNIDQKEFDKQLIAYIPNCQEGDYSYNFTVWSDEFPDNTTVAGYFQWRWIPGDDTDWYNCARLDILYSDEKMTVIQPSKATTAEAGPSDTDYYRTMISPGKSVYIYTNGPNSGSVTVRSHSYLVPDDMTSELNANVSAKSSYGVGSCGISAANVSTYLTVSSSTDAVGSYSLTAYEYEPFVDFLKDAPQITDHIDGPGYKFYYVLAFSTQEIPKRIIVKSTDPQTIYLTHGLTCDPSAPASISGKSSVCTKLGTQDEKKYIQVRGDAAMSYTISVEKGTCEDVNNSSYQLGTSMVVVMLSVLLFVIA